MKKLKLRALSLGATEILSREQLKTITGGSTAGCSTVGDCPDDYYCGNSGHCVYAGIPGSGSNGSGPYGGGSISETCDTIPDGHGGQQPACPKYSTPGHVFVGCGPCY